MKSTATGFFLLAAFASIAATGTHAQSIRTFVSGQGGDGGSCTLALPCRTFSYAIGQTSPAGEVVVLNTGGYGSFAITKAISIVNESGSEAGVTNTAGSDAIVIAAGPNDVVNLRGLTVLGGGISNNGITFNSGGALNIQNCVVHDFTGNGINLMPGTSNIALSDTVVSDNGNQGIYFAPSNNATALFVRVQAIGNVGAGFYVQAPNAQSKKIQAIAFDSVAAGNGGFGFFANGGPSPVPNFMLVNTTAFNNQNGIGSDFAAMIMAHSSTFANPSGGAIAIADLPGTPQGAIGTYQNNDISDTPNGPFLQLNEQ